MTNILPPEELRQLTYAFRARIMMVGALFSAGVALVGIVLITPSYWLTTRAQRDMVSLSQNTTAANTQTIEKSELAYDATLAQLLIQNTQHVRAGSIVEAVFDAVPQGVNMQHIAISKNAIALQGVASRTLLDTFKKNISANSRFKSISTPTITLQDNNYLLFSMTVTY